MLLTQPISFPNLGIVLNNVPKSFTIGGFSIAMYGIIIGIGIICGYLMSAWTADRTGQDRDFYLDVALYAVIVGILCARAYYVIFRWDYYGKNPIQILNFRGGGLAIYGGVIGGVATCVVISLIKKYSFPLILDTAGVGLVTGQMIGRWGNFCNREAFGRYTNNLFAMRLSVEDVRANEITAQMLSEAELGGYTGFIQVHPTFLYESLWNLGILIILIFMTKRKVFNGEVFLIYLGLYGIGRAWIEGLRTDQLHFWGTEIPVSQVLAVALAVFSFLTIAIVRRVKKKRDGVSA